MQGGCSLPLARKPRADSHLETGEIETANLIAVLFFLG